MNDDNDVVVDYDDDDDDIAWVTIILLSFTWIMNVNMNKKWGMIDMESWVATGL